MLMGSVFLFCILPELRIVGQGRPFYSMILVPLQDQSLVEVCQIDKHGILQVKE